MAYQALYRKWRPLIFEDVVGQTHITETLKNQILTGTTSHAYLMCGTRGTGKTSTAKILSRALNCIALENGNPCNACDHCKGILEGSIMDVVEIDAASNNGVDNIREIREEVNFSPAYVQNKVYIIDEVHMLSTGAFNALLKTLEEPPSHVIFILATTDPHKLPATILSRCQRFDFKRIVSTDIAGRMLEIIQKDDLHVEDGAVMAVARAADGSMRDALSILDQCIAFGQGVVTTDNVHAILGVSDHTVLFEIADALAHHQSGQIATIIQRLSESGKDYLRLMDELCEHFRNLLMCKVVTNPKQVINADVAVIEKLVAQSELFSQDKLHFGITTLTETFASAKWVSNARVLLEITLLKLCHDYLMPPDQAIAERLATVERQIAHGVVLQDRAPANSEDTPVLPTAKEVAKKLVDSVGTEQVNHAVRLWTDILKEVSEGNPLLGMLASAVPKGAGSYLAVVFDDNLLEPMKLLKDQGVMAKLEDTVLHVVGSAVPVRFVLKKEYDKDEPIRATFLQQLIHNEALQGIMTVHD
ncbi:MAG: DNA polymerase III subunit gamma/tau [Hyphomonadaceae bacterium]|nr:DNA polymerase III subunit gamma/tau [Clostridia bacterium]